MVIIKNNNTSCKLLFMSLVIILWIMDSEAFAQEVISTTDNHSELPEIEFCPPYSEADSNQLLNISQDTEIESSPYIITVQEDGKRRHVNIVSDHLVLNRQTLGALITTPSTADETISLIKIEARKVTFAAPISLSNAGININASEVDFAMGGVIHVNHGPLSKIQINTNRLRFLTDGYYSFDYRPPSPISGITGKILTIKASEIFFGTKLAPSPEPTKNLSGLFSFSSQVDFSPYIDVVTGEKASEDVDWVAAMEKSWLDYTASLWETSFRLAPFSRPSNQAISKAINDIKPLFDKKIKAVRAQHTISMIEEAIKAKVDLEGNGPAFAPLLPLSYLRSEIANYETAESQGTIRIAELIKVLGRLGDITAPLTEQELSLLVRDKLDELRKIQDDMDKDSSRLTELAQDLSIKNSKLEQFTKEYRNRENVLLADAKALESDARNRQAILTGLATAASILTTAYTGNPNTGSAAGGIIYGLGNGLNGQRVFTSLAAGYQFAQELAGPLSSVSDSLKALDSTYRTYKSFCRKPCQLKGLTIEESIEVPENPDSPIMKKVTRDEALSELSDKAKNANKHLSELKNAYMTFKEKASEVPTNLEEDKSLKMLAADIQNILEETKKLAIEAEAMNRALQENGNKQAKLIDDIAKLTTIRIENAERTQANVLIILDAIEKEFSTFVRLVQSLQKVSLYEYFQPVPIVNRLLHDLIASNKLSQANDKEKLKEIKGQKKLIEAYVQLATERLENMNNIAKNIHQVADQQFLDYLNKRGSKPAMSYPDFKFPSSDRATAEKAFIRQINDTLNEQYEARNNSELFNKLLDRRIPVPYSLTYKISDANYPARLVQARVMNLEPKNNIQELELHFQLEVERVGNLRRRPFFGDGSCYSIDFRTKDSELADYYKTFSVSLSELKSGYKFEKTPVNFWPLHPNDTLPKGETVFINYPAAEARMYLKVWIEPKSAWINPPKIDQISIRMEVYQ